MKKANTQLDVFLRPEIAIHFFLLLFLSHGSFNSISDETIRLGLTSPVWRGWEPAASQTIPETIVRYTERPQREVPEV